MGSFYWSGRVGAAESDCDRRLDRGVRGVAFQCEIPVFEAENIVYRRIEPHLRERIGSTRELLARLIQVIEVKMRVAQSVHEFARIEIAYLRQPQRRQAWERMQ